MVEHAATDSKELITAAKIGTVYWFTGLPGAGKTSIADEIFRELRLLKRRLSRWGPGAKALNVEASHYGLNERLKLAKKAGSANFCPRKRCNQLYQQFLCFMKFEIECKNLHSYKKSTLK